MSLGTLDGKTPAIAAAFLLGITSTMVQLVLLREMLCVYHGNELVLGILLGHWFLLAGVGAWGGRRRLRDRSDFPRCSLGVFLAGLLVLAWVPVLVLLALRMGLHLFFVRGAMIGPVGTLWSSLVLLLPCGLLVGWLLVWASLLAEYQTGSTTAISRIYAADGLGSLIGGVVFTFVLVVWLDHLAILIVAGLMLSLFVVVVARAIRLRGLWCWGLSVTALLLVINWNGLLDEQSIGAQYPGQRLVLVANSPYGRTLVTEYGGQYQMVENGMVVASTDQVEPAEEAAHYAMSQHPQARWVLVVGGALSGIVPEVLKYHPEHVVCVDHDARLNEMARRYLPGVWQDSRVQWIATDARRHIRQTTHRYDVVILNLPDPSTSMINRYFTREFYRETRQILARDGVLSFALGRYENYISPVQARLLSTAYTTVREVFPEVILLPGLRTFFLASERTLDSDVASRLKERNIATRFVSEAYLRGMFTADRLADLKRAVEDKGEINRDFQPVLYLSHVRSWIDQFADTRTAAWASAVFLFIVAVLGLRWHPESLAILVSGFSASAMEVVLIVVFQIACGALYQGLGGLVALFMGGLVVGSMVGRRIPPGRRSLGWTALALGLYAALVPTAFSAGWGGGRSSVGLWQSSWTIALILAGLAVLVGMEFVVASRQAETQRFSLASRLYQADFLGAFLGAVLTGACLVPAVGLHWTCWLTAALNGIIGWFMIVRTKSP